MIYSLSNAISSTRDCPVTGSTDRTFEYTRFTIRNNVKNKIEIEKAVRMHKIKPIPEKACQILRNAKGYFDVVYIRLKLSSLNYQPNGNRTGHTDYVLEAVEGHTCAALIETI